MGLVLDMRGLETTFTTREGVVNAVNGVSLSIGKGETLGIVGESGSGKSVTMLALLGLIPQPPGKITAGEALFNGRDLLSLPPRELQKVRGAKISMIFQDPMTSFNPVVPIGRQIAEPLMLHQAVSRRTAENRAEEMLTLVGIPNARERLAHFPHQFSGGMRQRAMIAMALICYPELLIADEPTTALDVTVQAQIVQLVKQLQKKLGMAVVWITHDLGVVAGIADRIAVMYGGSIVEEADVNALYENPQHPYTRGLLGSLPRLDAKTRERLKPIGGHPPIILEKPTQCNFAPRCHLVRDVCRLKPPILKKISGGHKVACWAQER